MKTITDNKTVNDLSISERRQLKKHLKNILENRKNQRALFFELFIKPIDDQIVVINSTLKGHIPIRRFVSSHKHYNKYFEKTKKEMKNEW